MNFYNETISIQPVIITWLLAIIFILSLIALFINRPVSLYNGMLLIPSTGLLILAISLTALHFRWYPILGVLLTIFIVVFVLIAILSYLSGILLLWNAAIVWRHEQHSIANSLTLVIGSYLILSPLLLGVLRTILPSMLFRFLTDIEGMIFFYLMMWLLCYGLSFFIYRFIKPKYDKEYLIVLGAGLLNGDQISPLLKRRVQRGLDFANEQYAQTGVYPYVVMSGGQGGDEKIPESVAMTNYALSVGFPEQQLIVEDQSKTTVQNMQYSKQKLLEKGFDLTKGLFVTSDYHVFRAGIFAFDNGLHINGIGAHTRLYFLFNALIREFIAILARYKKTHIIMVIIFIILALLDVAFIPWFLKNYYI
ncbi:YdcF family protein [Periweissella fabaria]|uniref:DUF218 domain-containing protein n=1 Tax=Periweissella fabaria TaxID=546157 RepID=A0ABM8Z470_9LACO|nr:YdcF family protein [Periweissella fabaria]MCM0597484.1 YdcF family protein [Periweissella fabaria]CAH0416012.1 hypothetical protein WFA24289_00311 [Periweissella fabaria]